MLGRGQLGERIYGEAFEADDRTVVMASRRRISWEGGTPLAPRLVVGDRVTAEMDGDDGVVVAVHARDALPPVDRP